MIVFTGDDVKYNNKEAKRYDGVYYAIILNSVKSSNNLDYLCYVYVPEIFGDVDNSKGRLYYRCYDYIRVLVPENTDDCNVSDEDRKKNIPSIGKIIKVSFDDGDINSCRYLMTIPIDEIYEKMNSSYVKEGILPTEVIENITDDSILDIFTPMVRIGNYITTGYESPPAKCYKYKFLWSNVREKQGSDLSTFRNWFIEALTMPLQSYGGKNNQFGQLFYPYYSTDIYNLYFVLKAVIDSGNYNKLASVYSNLLTDENGIAGYSDIMFSFKSRKSKLDAEQDRAKIVSLWFLGLFTGLDRKANDADVALASVAYPGVTDDYLTPCVLCGTGVEGYDCSAEYLWKFESYYESGNIGDKEAVEKLEPYRFYNILNDKKIKTIYEKHYLSVLATWTTGINNLTKDIKFRNVILMCLTIAPWFASPLLRYTTTDKELIKAMLKFRTTIESSESKNIDKIYINFVENNIGNIENASIFPNQDAYLSFREDMQKYIESGNKNAFIDKFEYFVEFYLCNKVYNNNNADYDSSACVTKKDMQAKFKRLKDIAKKEKWL